MHHIAVHNVYGVDLNPTAVELGALSLWLASIHRLKLRTGENGAPDTYHACATPWFGLRLRPGNSLIGARRAVWTEEQLTKGRSVGSKAEAPCQLQPSEPRRPGEINHYLVWEEDMAPVAKDRLMRSFWSAECRAIGDWQRHQVKQRWTLEQLASARRICERIDQLWQDYAAERLAGLVQTRCASSVWPAPIPDRISGAGADAAASLARQEAVKAQLEADSGAFQRLRLLIGRLVQPLLLAPGRRRQPAQPRRLAGRRRGVARRRRCRDTPPARPALGDAIDLEGLFAAVLGTLLDASALACAVPWFGVARATVARQPFHHSELVFTEVLGLGSEGQMDPPRGFDLMFGNPPWIKVSWNDAPLLAEFEPRLGVRDAKSATYNRERARLLETPHQRIAYRDAFEQGEGVGVFLNDRTLYPSLAGVQTNLYKNFIERSWAVLGGQGVAGLLHPEGVFDDPKGGVFREAYYQRLMAHYQFKNEQILFADIGNRVAFSVNVYSGSSRAANARMIFNLFSPMTIQSSYEHAHPNDPIPAIKTENDQWETRGHAERILTITEHELALFARLFEDADTPPLQARLPQVHSRPLLKVLEKFAAAPRRLGDLKGEYLATVMFDETYAQRDGIITRQEDPSFQPERPDDWVLSGPHFFVGTPLNKTPFTNVINQRSYDDFDLTDIPDDYLPRAVYRNGDRNGDLSAFHKAIPEWPKPRKPREEEVTRSREAAKDDIDVGCGEGRTAPRPDADPGTPAMRGDNRGGFWPISDAEVPAYEALLAEPLRRYGIDPSKPGARTARQFGWFVEWQGDVEGAVHWLLANDAKATPRPSSSGLPG